MATLYSGSMPARSAICFQKRIDWRGEVPWARASDGNASEQQGAARRVMTVMEVVSEPAL
jgi:hypothetical protein